jgi:hypothetical protein
MCGNSAHIGRQCVRLNGVDSGVIDQWNCDALVHDRTID